MTTTPSKKTERPIQLKWDGGAVVISPEDESRFVMQSQSAVSACQNQLAFERFIDQLKNDFLTGIHGWCVKHSDRVAAAFAVISTQHMQVFVITQADRYDFALSDDLSDLEMDLYERAWPCEVVQIPDGSAESLQTFFDAERSIQIYGNSSGTSREGEEPSGFSRDDS